MFRSVLGKKSVGTISLSPFFYLLQLLNNKFGGGRLVILFTLYCDYLSSNLAQESRLQFLFCKLYDKDENRGRK